MTETIASTTYGRLQGIEDDGIVRFKGIPFAAPPVGDLRFRAPQPPTAWPGVRDATQFGPTSLQNPSPIEAIFGAEVEPMSEDCLFLNVYTPAVDSGRRPVMVWIHGGGFLMGSGSGPMYDGGSFPRRGDVVFVSLNYRLAELGFLELAHLDESYAGSGNNGILDQVAALEWVRDNIATFGGDPDNVTIFGESAGGMSVGALLATPAARGLFHKAIAQSGAVHNVIPQKVAAQVTDEYMARLQAASVADLLEIPTDTLLAERQNFVMERMLDVGSIVGGDGPPLGMPFQPVHDSTVIPQAAIDAVRAGSAPVPLLVGTNRDEWKLFGLMDMGEITDEVILARASGLIGDGQTFIDAYRADNPDLDPKGLFGEMANDFAFRIPAIRLAEVQAEHAEVWMYLFDWKSRAFGGALGACHAMELPFVFHNVGTDTIALFIGEGPIPTDLADRMQDAWIAFARTGNPSHEGIPDWPVYEPETRATMQFSEPCQLIDDPMPATRALWDTV